MLPLTADFSRSTDARELERLEPREQVPEDRLDLDAREVRAQADVLTEAEREVRVRVGDRCGTRTGRRTRPRRGSADAKYSAS